MSPNNLRTTKTENAFSPLTIKKLLLTANRCWVIVTGIGSYQLLFLRLQIKACLLNRDRFVLAKVRPKLLAKVVRPKC